MQEKFSDNHYYQTSSLSHTEEEIEGQPKLWLKIWDYINSRQSEINNYLQPLLKNEHLQVVVTGAGSSAFIGESIQHAFKFSQKTSTIAISTTTLVTHFKNYIPLDSPILLISFARSGNSPESLAVIDLAENYCSNIHHIAITCNEKGDLAKKIGSLKNGLVLALPAGSEDKGLAMTGSFTGMQLAALLIASLSEIKSLKEIVRRVADIAQNLLNQHSSVLEEIVSQDFKRIIFLGSGPLLSIARESHLKVQELTDGKIIGKYDSYLGFRHGPKAVIDDKSIIVYLFSHDNHIFQYEKDLVDQISNDGFYFKTIGIFPSSQKAEKVSCDHNVILEPSLNMDDSGLGSLPYVLPAQMIGLYKAIQIGLDPDSPSRNNVISRVVEGVIIYPEK